ncbi:MAG: hypothetical protein FJ207_05915 [Gemmatimonadetes bacterium]|nr:hypothetical protein [Gemmatimonadota bacterium]
MREDRKSRLPSSVPTLERADAASRPEAGHVVFDFTGLERPDVGDLLLILTARLQSAPTDSVWVRSLPEQTERLLRILRLDHLFRAYPEGSDELN